MASQFALVVLALAACADPVEGRLTDSTCPPTDKPTYASFAGTFFQTYCLHCHSQTNAGDDRHGAPPTIDFDSEALVRENTSRIDKQAAAGETIVNRLMPQPDRAKSLGLPFPSDDERYRLGQYLACVVGR